MDPATLPRGSGDDLRDRLTQALVRIRDHQAHPFQPSLDQAPKERNPELVILALAGLNSQDVALTGLGDPDRDDRGNRGDSPSLADLVERGIEPHVGVLALDRASKERP